MALFALWVLLAVSMVALGSSVFLLVRGVLYRHRRTAQPHTLVVCQRQNHGNGWFTLTLQRPGPLRMLPLPRFEGGQSVALSLPGSHLRRHYSLARWSKRPFQYEVSIKPEPQGKLSQLLAAQALQGTRLQVSRPSGQFTLRTDSPTRRQVLIAGGIGITPLLAMLDQWSRQRHRPDQELHLYWQSRHPGDWIYHDVLNAYATTMESVRVRLLASRAEDGKATRISVSLLQAQLGSLDDTQFLMCAGSQMLDNLSEGLLNAGVPASHIHFERFTSGAVPSDTGNWTLQIEGRTVPFAGHAHVLSALEDAQVPLAADCRTGTCGQCCVRVISGQTRSLLESEFKVSAGHCLACCTVPLSDLQLGRPGHSTS
ncbi:MAG: iron-sulfur cluster-binding domain-containing protein [Acidovorax sp.]|nr:iron-sulfur cluster-binding domain-containing protein [Acidovorax sp.]